MKTKQKTISQQDVARALLEIYAYRVDRDEKHRLAVGSFALAITNRLCGEAMQAKFDRARCALWYLSQGQEPPRRYLRSLNSIAPKLTLLRRCSECGTWRVHTLACPVLNRLDAEAAARNVQ